MCAKSCHKSRTLFIKYIKCIQWCLIIFHEIIEHVTYLLFVLYIVVFSLSLYIYICIRTPFRCT